MLETRDLTKVYDNTILAVNKLNLKVNPEEIYVVLGANGAGKSTTISMLLNFIDPTSGTALVNDNRDSQVSVGSEKASRLRLRKCRVVSEFHRTTKLGILC